MAGGEHWACATQDHHTHVVIGLGAQEGIVELDQQSPALSVTCVGAVEGDPNDTAVVQRLVGDVTELCHKFPLPILGASMGTKRRLESRMPIMQISVAFYDSDSFAML